MWRLVYTQMNSITIFYGGAVTCTLLVFILKTQMSSVNALTQSCELSPLTVEVVGRCPSDTDSYMRAAARKNCTALQHDCASFEYHCVINNHKNTTIEVCAPSIRITGGVCAGYDLRLKSISRMEGINCGDFTPSCPNNYNSTEAYKYSSCYESVSHSATFEDTTLVNKRVVYSNSKEKQPQKTNNPAHVDGNDSTGGGVIGGVLAIIAVILLVLVVLYLKRQGKVCNCKKRKPSDEDIEMSRGLSSAPAVSVREDPDEQDNPDDKTCGGMDFLLRKSDQDNPYDKTFGGMDFLVRKSDQDNPDDKSCGGMDFLLRKSDQDNPDDKTCGEDISQADALQKKLSEIVGSKNPAYREKHIRKLSFDTCNTFLKNMCEEFAAAGFFYKGIETHVICFHCGQEMSDWTEDDTEDDIINKHYQLNKTCDYIHIIRQYRKM